MENILLVEPDYRTDYLPLGLQKIAAYHLNNGDAVKYIKGTKFNDFTPDKIYITTLFTYTANKVIETIKFYQNKFPKANIKVGGIFASLMPDYIIKETNIIPHKGIIKEMDNLIPDYSVFPESKKSIIFTTRGCPRKCAFCAVKTLEDFSIIPNWKEHINLDKAHIVIQDNNILSTPWEHQVSVVNHLKTLKGKRIEFNGGFDCFRFKEKHAQLYSQIKINPVRFAFDEMIQDGHIQRAIELAKQYKIANDYTVYVLYNFKDKPEDFYYRAKEMIKLKVSVYPMRYTPLDDIEKKYVSPNWNQQMLTNLNNLIRHNSWGRIMIFGRFKLEDFERIYGRNEQEFVDIISNYHLK